MTTNKIEILLNLLTKKQQIELKFHDKNQPNLILKLINLYCTKKELSEKKKQEFLNVSESTFNKINSKAKDFIIDCLKKIVETTFDGIYVIQRIIFAGEIDFAQKLLNEMEKELEQKQLWMHLEVLYIEASRIFYTTGNVDGSKKLTKKRIENSDRLAKYISLNSRILDEMLQIEGFKSRKLDVRIYHKKILALQKEAQLLNHHVLIHNALHLNYMFASRNFQEPELVHQIIIEMQKNLKKYENVMHPFSKAIINNTNLNFLTIYNGFGNPEKFVKKVKRSIYNAGNVAGVNMCYAMLEYYLYEKNIPKVMVWLLELEKIEDNSKFRQYKHIIFAIKGFIENDYSLFNKHFAAFYNDPSHLDFPDMEVNLRLMELMILSIKKDQDLLESKITSLKKYMSRNVNQERYLGERKLLLLLEKTTRGNSLSMNATINQLINSNYRNIVFLAKKLKNK